MAWKRLVPTGNKKLTLIQSLLIIKMKASGYFVDWNLSTIKSLVSNYQTATVGLEGDVRLDGMESHFLYIETIHLQHGLDDNLHNCLTY